MIALLSLAAVAAEPVWSTAGDVRVVGTVRPEPVIDDMGTTLDQGPVVDSRVRASGDVVIGRFRAGTEWDLLAGQLVGDTWALSDTPDARGRDTLGAASVAGIVPRRLSAGVRLSFLDIEAGLMTSQWGLGILANDGAGAPLFGRRDFGDRVARLRLTTLPFGEDGTPLFIVAAADAVVADELARWSDGERAYQGVLSVFYADAEGRRLGAYGVVRRQREADVTRHTNVGVLDVYGALPVDMGDWRLELATEAAGFVGRTDRVVTYDGRDGLSVLAGGGAVHTALWSPEDRVGLHLRGAWASGDADPDDDRFGTFTFDRDYEMGSVLFDETLAAMEVGTWTQLTDPEHSAAAPDGAEALVREGALSGVTALQPAVQVVPRPWLDARAGLVLAWGTAPVGQAFASFRSGGVPTTVTGRPAGGYALGTEVDWSVTVQQGDEEARLRPQASLQGGHAFLSKNLAPAGTRHDLVFLTGRLLW